MLKLALLGKNIQHSKSQLMYEKILNKKINYTLFDFADESKVPSLDVLFHEINGLSITSPYKKVFLDQVKVDAFTKNIGAINCVRKDADGYSATNTDYLAMKDLIKIYYDKMENGVFILGDGAMGRLTEILCNELQISYKSFSRKLNNLSHVAQEVKNLKGQVLIINACAREYIFDQKLSQNAVFWDLNYNMPRHLQIFQSQNLTYIDGLSLLELQARYALRFWNHDFS